MIAVSIVEPGTAKLCLRAHRLTNSNLKFVRYRVALVLTTICSNLDCFQMVYSEACVVWDAVIGKLRTSNPRKARKRRRTGCATRAVPLCGPLPCLGFGKLVKLLIYDQSLVEADLSYNVRCVYVHS